MPSPQRLIDIHCHTAGTGAGNSGCFVSPKLRNSWKYAIYLRAFGVSEKELLAEGDGLILRRLSEQLAGSQRVSAAVVLAMDGVVDDSGALDLGETEVYVPSSFIAREIRNYPNLLLGASINPNRKDALDQLEEAAACGARLVKWLPSIQRIDPGDKRISPFYRRMRELGIPLLSHTGNEYSFTRAFNEFADPERLRLPLQLGVTVIAAHAASNGRSRGEPNFRRFLRLAGEFPNLLADVSALTQMNRLGHLARLLKRRELHGRLLYGTDMPLLNTGIVLPLAFLFSIPLPRIIAISRIANPWDRDVALKESLGMSDGMLGELCKA